MPERSMEELLPRLSPQNTLQGETWNVAPATRATFHIPNISVYKCICTYSVGSFPGHFQIYSTPDFLHGCQTKSGSGLGRRPLIAWFTTLSYLIYSDVVKIDAHSFDKGFWQLDGAACLLLHLPASLNLMDIVHKCHSECQIHEQKSSE